MARTAYVIGGVSIVAAPVLVAIADELRMAAEPPASEGLVDAEYGVDSILAGLQVIEQNRGLFTVGAVLSYAAVLVLVPSLLAIWRASVGRAPGWAWAGAVMAMLGVTGSMVHVTGYHGSTLTALDFADRTGAAEFMVALESNGFVIALYAPFFLALLCPIPQAIGLFRAKVIPLWACLAVVTGAVVSAVIGSTPWSTALAGVLFVAGLAPAAAAMIRRGPVDALDSERVPVTA
jgi:hypothetical protein